MLIKDVVENDLCIGCGLCANSSDVIWPDFFENGKLIPVLKSLNSLSKEIEGSCPGKGYEIQRISADLFSNVDKIRFHDLLGYYNGIFGLRTLKAGFRKYASSGGIMPTVMSYALDNKLVDAILTCEMKYSDNGPIALPVWITKSSMISPDIQGSKYMPVPLLQDFIKGLSLYNSVAVVGTPCQIAGVRNYLELSDARFKDKLVFTLSNFCGGFRDFRESEKIIKMFNFNLKGIINYRFRGNGHPGFMTIQDKNRSVKLPYPDYAGLTGVQKMKRCKLCVDATGELSDLSFGDAWIPQLNGMGYSIVLSRSEFGANLIRKMMLDGLFDEVNISEEDVVNAQKGNLTTKKIRQNSRFKLYGILQKKVPFFDGGYRSGNINIWFEIKVMVSQIVKPFFLKFKIKRKINKLNNYEK